MPTNPSQQVMNTVFNATIELSTLNGKNGFIINGIAADDYSGYSVASAGDINGDGIQDMIIGAPYASPAGKTWAGQSYVVFGKRNGWASSLELSSLNGMNGFAINGIAVTDYSASSLAFAGDINGDGLQDVMIGTPNPRPAGRSVAGQSYVIFGRQGSWTSSVELSSLNGTNGFIINGIAAGDRSGRSIAGAGDINGDGLQDVIIGAPTASPSGKNSAGQSYLVFGKRNAWTSPLELSSLNGTNGFIINGIAAPDSSGWSVASAGDINGDGLQDIIIGASLASPAGKNMAGQSYVIFGKPIWTSSLELSSLNGSNGFILNGIAARDDSGWSVASAGDINGDGLQDIIIGAYGARNYTGQSYVIFGKRSGWTSPLGLSSLNGTNGFILNGIAARDDSGYSVASARDINGDGLPDMIIGAPYASPANKTNAGQSYVIFGKRSGWTSPLELASLNGTNGFILNGIAASDGSGNSVAPTGDINGDGLGDIIIGAPGVAFTGRANVGQSYVVFGDLSISIINNQLNISAGQSVILNSNSLFAFTGNYTSEVYFNVSGIQNGYFQLLNNPGVAVTQFTQTQLNNNLVQFVSTSSAAPFYSVSASTGIGNAIAPAPQSAQINFVVPTITTVFNPKIELSSLNGKNGFAINGIAAGDYSGFSVASAGDINGDGITDLVIGAYHANSNALSLAGQSYVVFGQRTPWTSSLELSSLNGSNGFIINGITTNDNSGSSVASARDINGDGLSDIIIGAYLANPAGKTQAGQSYIVFGSRGKWGSSLELSNLNGANGFILNGVSANSLSGFSVASVGDINGDDLQDVIIGAYEASPAGRTYAGQSYVVFGKQEWISPLELSSLNGTNGFILNGVAINDRSGLSIASASDVNGDGFQDMIIGAPYASPAGRTYAGQSYVVFGKQKWISPLELSSLNGTNGFILNGIAASDYSGRSVASAGDINGDGLSDIIIGAIASPGGRNEAGQSYLIFGKRNWTSPLELSSLNGTNGIVLNGIVAGDHSGISVVSAGDINGDGLQDILIGADNANPAGRVNAGQSYVIFGKVSNWISLLELSSLNGVNGFILNGVVAGDHSGISVASASDINDDGLQDMIIGAYWASPANRSKAGQSYVVFGDISIPIITNQLNISAGQSVILSSNSLFAYTGNYTGEIYFNVSNVQNGYFQLLNNLGVAVTQFTQTQLNNGLVQFVSSSSAAPSYSVSASTGIGSAIMPAPQAAQINFVVPTITTVFNPTIELANLNGKNGFTLNGIAINDNSGWSVAPAGDINGDGMADLVIGARQANPSSRSGAGQSYVVFGKRTAWTSPLELSSLNGTNGLIINGIAANDNSGYSVALAEDINGDGVADLVIGALGASPSGRSGAGQSYMVFGKRTAWTSPLELSSLNGTNGLIINGIAANDQIGILVASAGDMNGDGLTDVVIGSNLANPSGRSGAGQSYVVFGQRTAWVSPLELSSLNGTNGFIVNGIAANDQSGRSVASAGDINGDGIADLVIGAPYASPSGRTNAGQSYVVFGKRTAWASLLELSSLNGTRGFIVNGIASNDNSGWSVASAGDINGDGVADVVIGARDASPSGRTNAGQSYVVFGKRTAWASPLELTSLNGANGFILNGIAAYDDSGVRVASAGDINGDGVADLVIGARYASPSGRTNAGQSYVVFGKCTAWASLLELSSLNGTTGFIVNGIAANDDSGRTVASAGDINGDGVADLVIGALGASPGGRTDAGQSYVVFGDLSIPIINNQLTISAGQPATLNSNSLFAFTGNYTGEIYFNVSNMQNGYFQLINNPNIAITQFTQTQLNNNLVQFVSSGSATPSYLVSASTGIGNAIPLTPQAAQIYFTPSMTTISTATLTPTYTNASTPVPTTVQVTTTASPIPTTTTVVTTPQGNITITTTPLGTTVSSSSSSVVFTTSSSSSSSSTSTATTSTSTISSSSSSSMPTTQPMISSTSSSSTSITIPTSNGVINITSTTSGQVTVTVPPTMTMTSANTATTTTSAMVQNTAAVSSTALMSASLASTAAASSASVMTSTSMPKSSSTTTPALIAANKDSSNGVSTTVIAAAVGAGGAAVVLLALYLLHRYRKQRLAITQDDHAPVAAKNKIYLPDHSVLSETDVDGADQGQYEIVEPYEKFPESHTNWSSFYAAGHATEKPQQDAWGSSNYATRADQSNWSSLYAASHAAEKPQQDAWALSDYATHDSAETPWNNRMYNV